jgi:hypothetical protein
VEFVQRNQGARVTGIALLIQRRPREGTRHGQLGRNRSLTEHGCPLQLLQFARFCPEKL